tara:strand:+ start:90 stop:299 length:210 start_codon:yes stop_codon:yes gene_type:complete
VKYNNDSPAEIILGVCDKCENYVPFIRLVTEEDERIYECISCKAKHKQYINGKVTFNYLDDSYVFKTIK